MAWTVPNGCYYAVYTSASTWVYYNTGASVPTENAPNKGSGTSGNTYVLLDFSNGYIYNGATLSTMTLNITANNTFTVTSISSFKIKGACHVYAMRPENLTLTGTQFTFGNGSGLLNKTAFMHSGYSYNMNSTFSGRTDITSVTIPNGVYSMNSCFKGCTSLTTVSEIPSGVTAMNSCFRGCVALTTPPVIPNSVIDMDSCFFDCTSLTTAPVIPNSVTDMAYCFYGCTSLTTAPAIPSGVTDMSYCFCDCALLTTAPAIPSGVTAMNSCFRRCIALITPPVIPSNVINMVSCFSECVALTTPPAIPSSVTDMSYCFRGCASLAGNIVVSNNPNAILSVFYGTKKDIYIVNDNAGTVWKDSIVPSYSNVHYEADDNTVPSVSMNVTRVDSALSEVQTPTGEYAYINAQVQLYEDYLPVGWSNSLPDPNGSSSTTTVKKDGTTQTVTWIDTDVGLLYSLKCWINLGDIVKHTFTLQTADKIVDDNNTQKASHLSAIVTQILSKAYKLVDYYHESDQTDPNYDTEGFAIGKYATQANLFDVDMPSRFRDSVIIDRLVGEIKAYAGATVPTGWLECDGTEVAIADYPLLYNAIGNLWGTASDADHFVLPNLKGRVPVGQNTADTDFDTVGDDGGSKYIQQHSHSSTFTRPTISSGGSWYFEVTALGARTGATTLASAGTNTTQSASKNTRYKIANNSNTASGGTSMIDKITHSGHAHGSTGGSVSVGNINTSGLSTGSAGNLQPYAVVKYIICAV